MIGCGTVWMLKPRICNAAFTLWLISLLDHFKVKQLYLFYFGIFVPVTLNRDLNGAGDTMYSADLKS